MKQILLLLIAVAIAAGTYLFYQDENSFEALKQSTSELTEAAKTKTASVLGDNGITTNVDGLEPDEDEDDYEEYDDRPASEVYKNYDDALAAVKKGAMDYDDIVLEQFVQPGEDCTFCEALYKEVTVLMKDPNASEDERAYYSELLAISGRKENIEELVNSVRSATDEDAADIYAESLELTIAGDDVVQYLSDFMKDENELLQESAVAAITNQGSKLAAQTLYDHTVEAGDPDGYYAIGLGIAEMIPEESSLPYLQEKASQKDQYSHLAVKALLNYGYDGLVLVFDTLAGSDDPELYTKLLQDAGDHVGYEEQTEKFIDDLLASGNASPTAEKFANDIKEGFADEAEFEDLDDDEDEDDY